MMKIKYTEEEKKEIFRIIFNNEEPKSRKTKIIINAMRVYMGLKPKYHVEEQEQEQDNK